jgi:hypothetical protein
MFEITEETKAAAVDAMREVLSKGVSDATLGDAFEVAVEIVKKQFGI